jgi:hypothetical protein
MLTYADEGVGAVDTGDERLHAESVRQLARELGSVHTDPTGTFAGAC